MVFTRAGPPDRVAALLECPLLFSMRFGIRFQESYRGGKIENGDGIFSETQLVVGFQLSKGARAVVEFDRVFGAEGVEKELLFDQL